MNIAFVIENKAGVKLEIKVYSDRASHRLSSEQRQCTGVFVLAVQKQCQGIFFHSAAGQKDVGWTIHLLW